MTQPTDPRDGGGRAAWAAKIIDAIDIGLSYWDGQERLVMANRQFARQFPTAGGGMLRPGLSFANFIEHLAVAGEFVIAADQDDWVSGFMQAFRTRRVIQRDLGDGRCLEFNATTLDDGTLLNTQDVSLAKRGERAMRMAKEVAEESDAKKSRFLRAANHDLRQPLATLKILIYSSMEANDAALRQELLHAMDVTISIMEDILGALLQVGQLDAGRIVPRIGHFQVAQIFNRMKIEFGPQAEAQGLRLRVARCHATIESDRALLERILSNFLANAIRFTSIGTILLGARRRGGLLDIQVWDTGCGIAADQLDLIFEEFHQTDNRAESRQKGLGLGLNIAQRLAELLQHPVTVRSWPGRGSMFGVTVPIGNVWHSDVGEPEISERIGGEFVGINVLFVEDNDRLRETFTQLLERWGVTVRATRDGAQAAALLAAEAWVPDLLLVDFRLPHPLSGTDVLTNLRGQIGHATPGIVVTADADPDTIARIKQAGLPVLIKPISPSRLRSLMHHLLFESDVDAPAAGE